MALADYQQLVDDMVRDASGTLDSAARDRAIAQAVLSHGAAMPRTLAEDVVWPERGVFGPAPAHWMEGAWIKQAEHPVGEQPPRLIHVAALREPDGRWRLESVWPLPQGATVRLSYTAPHVVDDGQDTVPLQHRVPVAMLAASALCQQLATYYSGQRETAVGADASSTETRAREYASRAREYRSAYYAGVGLPDPFTRQGASAGSGVQAAAVVGHWPGRRRHGLHGGH